MPHIQDVMTAAEARELVRTILRLTGDDIEKRAFAIAVGWPLGAGPTVADDHAKQQRKQLKLKVYGWIGHFRKIDTHHVQSREIVAARSMAAAARAYGEKDPRRIFNLGETGNAHEISIAMSDPGRVFWKSLDANPRNDDPSVWTKAKVEGTD